MNLGLYQHWKGGLYILLAIADDSTNEGAHEGPLAVYFSVLYKKVHVRKLAEFQEEVPTQNGWVPRFKPIDGPTDLCLDLTSGE